MQQGRIEHIAATDPDRDCGILLGWKFDPAGDCVMLLAQNACKTWDARGFKYFVNKEQAMLLGNYLYGLEGETATVCKKPGFFARLFP